MAGSLLLVGRDAQALAAVRALLPAGDEIELTTVADGDEAVAVLERQGADVVLAMQEVAGASGLEILRRTAVLQPEAGLCLWAAGDAFAEDAYGIVVLREEADRLLLLEELSDAIERRTGERELRFLLERGGVSETQLGRARRIAARLQRERSLPELLVELGYLAQEERERLQREYRRSMELPDALRFDGALTPEAYREWRKQRAAAPHRDMREILVGGGLVSEETYLRALAERHPFGYVEPEVGLVNQRLIKESSLAYLRRIVAVPLLQVDDQLDIVVADPLNTILLQELTELFGSSLRLHCCCADKILATLDELEAQRNRGESGATALQYRELEIEDGDEDSSEDAVQVVDYLLLHAIQADASDLHIEPQETGLRVRIRVDGVMRDLISLPSDFAPRVIARLKVLADVDLSERRLHQDGRIMVRKSDRNIDIRFSSYAATFGENVVLRILDRARGLVPLESLGFESAVLAEIRDVVLRTSSGLVPVTGPTGSGKTTTLYSFVSYLNDPARKIISAEDPVEYMLPGVIQCNVNERYGPTFADSMRAIVRQDPDVILIGEIRDSTTAGLSVESALTGHKVFSTLHTEDSVGTMIRLGDLGVEPFMLASTLSAIVAQRLVRRICPDCRRSWDPDPRELRYLGLESGMLSETKLIRGAGCKACGGSGYRGRAGIHEVLLPDDDFRDLVLNRAPAGALRKHARSLHVFRSLQESGLALALAGVTTISEVINQTPHDREAPRVELVRRIAEEWRS